tara:strand:- start:5217 stop:5816 length:600 start_codon:yes stop_codon:yes gene_type:complete
MYPRQIQKLITLFSQFPTVGSRTAARFVFYLLKISQKDAEELVSAIAELKKDIVLCRLCFQPFDGREEEGLCALCKNQGRDKNILCIIEKESDLEALESTKQYQGLYFVLGGTVGTLAKEQRELLRTKELKERIEQSPFKEIIIATNPTTEGEATALYLERFLKSFQGKLTRLGRGLPIGGELEYADEETLRQSLENRR